MSDECLICGAPLEYMDHSEIMECSLCHKKEESAARCVNGHYICGDCHTKGIDKIVKFCLSETSKNPAEILLKLTGMDFCHMHGPEHHIIVGSSLLTAYKNAGGKLDLPSALTEMQKRGSQIPGGACGFWGACGAGISAGIFLSIALKATPLSKEEWSMCNLLTSRILAEIANIGGPRCCKRDSYIAVLTACDFVKEKLGVVMEKQKIVCGYSRNNNQCLGVKCPFNRINN